MFGFLKEKLKSWLGKAKDKAGREEVEEIDVAEKAEKKKEKVEKKDKKIKKVEKKLEKKEQKLKSRGEKLKNKGEKLKEKEIRALEDEQVEKAEEIGDELKEVNEEEKVIEKEEGEVKEKIEEIEEELEEIGQIKEETKSEVKIEEKKLGFFGKLKKFFITYQISEMEFNDIFSDLEMLLLENNVALEVVEQLRIQLHKELVGREMKKNEVQAEIENELKKALESMIIQPENTLASIKAYRRENNNKEPFVILFFGINGVGKTTSIAKFGNLLKKNNLSYVLAAADTFRAASIEQLQIHADKLGVNMIKHDYGADPSAVAFDAIKYAKAHGVDVVLVDTAGRMHTKDNLLNEMGKIVRVSKPNMKVFVAESIAGNDATEQARAFNDSIGIDGSILSKADVDEKGGTILSISYITKKPILYLGVGQNYDDIEPFDKDKFIERLGL